MDYGPALNNFHCLSPGERYLGKEHLTQRSGPFFDIASAVQY